MESSNNNDIIYTGQHKIMPVSPLVSQPVSPVINALPNPIHNPILNSLTEIDDIKSDLFYADINMINLLNNNDFSGYLMYIRNKQYFEKYGTNPYLVEAKKIIDSEVKIAIEIQKRKDALEKEEQLRIKLENKKKTDLLNNIYESIQRLENTLNFYNNRLRK
jgi:hypothetical protein